MHPILIDLGEVNLPLFGEVHFFIPTYGFIVMIAAFLTLMIWIKLSKREGFDVSRMIDLGFYLLLAGIVGSKAALLLVDFRYYLENPGEIIYIYKVAGVYLGGVIAALATIIIFALKNRLPLWRLSDTICIPLPLGQAIGRIGCFFAGCCFGRPAEGLSWAITFTNPIAHENTGVPLGIPLHPTQIYQSLNDFTLFLMLLVLWRFKKFDGEITWSYIFLYSLSRGIIELFRGDISRGLYFNGLLSTSQIIGSIGAISAAVILFILYRKSKKEAGSHGEKP
ncbi:MAG: prolipoprotein diacylglyceryl transferase [Acidobacteriota bacterium]